MKGGASFYLIGAGMLLALAGCGRSFMYGERAPWRHQAEVECLKSGAVKVGTGVVQIEPIEGPGMCGTDFPLKVAALGESSPLVGYADDPRPPGTIPSTSAQMPRWPINEPQYTPPAPVPSVQGAPMPAQSSQAPRMRWAPGPPPVERPTSVTPAREPISLSAPGAAVSGVTPGAAPLSDDIPDDAVLPPGRAPATYSPQRAYGAPVYQTPPRAYGAPQPRFAAARTRARSANNRHRHAGDADARRDAGLSDCLCARPLGKRGCAAGSDTMVRHAGRRNKTDLGVFLPRHGRRRWLGNFRTRVRQRDRHRGVHARRWTPDYGAGRLARHAGRAGVPARRPSRCLRQFYDGTGAGLQRRPLQSHPCRSDAAIERGTPLPAGGDPRRSGRSTSARRLCTASRSRIYRLNCAVTGWQTQQSADGSTRGGRRYRL